METVEAASSLADLRHVTLVTGTLAEPSVRAAAAELAMRFDVRAEVIVLRIQVAALMTGDWVMRKLRLAGDDRPQCVILPGYCRGDLRPLCEKLGLPVVRGPRDVHELAMMFDPERSGAPQHEGYGEYDIEIIAEINDAAHLPIDQIIAEAGSLAADGADVIDIGCDPQADRPAWDQIGQVVGQLRQGGHRVSVDSFHRREVELACAAGAELVLSVNSSNREAAGDWGAQVVVVPDDPHALTGLDETVEYLDGHGVAFRIDPIIEPIGFGFADSLGRYIEVRKRYPQAAMMMGIGNLSEMTGVDSAGVNMLLIGFCQELGIKSVLTTQVINWARSAVREIDVARRMAHYAVTRSTVPKHVDESLVMLRDPRVGSADDEALAALASRLTDDNFRLFADGGRGQIHAMNRQVHAAARDPFELFDQLGVTDASHAFYLGYEMAKAVTAMTLGKGYTQDEALRWGMLTREEVSHYEKRKGAGHKDE